jgi:hypothetical protein
MTNSPFPVWFNAAAEHSLVRKLSNAGTVPTMKWSVPLHKW